MLLLFFLFFFFTPLLFWFSAPDVDCALCEYMPVVFLPPVTEDFARHGPEALHHFHQSPQHGEAASVTDGSRQTQTYSKRPSLTLHRASCSLLVFREMIRLCMGLCLVFWYFHVKFKHLKHQSAGFQISSEIGDFWKERNCIAAEK